MSETLQAGLQPDTRNPRGMSKAGRVCLFDSEGHVSHRDHLRLRDKILRVADLVAADATRPASPPGKHAGALPDDIAIEDGEAYLCIRQAFSSAFDELLEQTIDPEQASVVEELWTSLADYLDRMMARADVAINDSAEHQRVRDELERELRLLSARCKVLEGQLQGRKEPGRAQPGAQTGSAGSHQSGGAQQGKAGAQLHLHDVGGAAGASTLHSRLADLADRPRSAAAKGAGSRQLAQVSGSLGESSTAAVATTELTPVGQQVRARYSRAVDVAAAAAVQQVVPPAAARQVEGPSERQGSGKAPVAQCVQDYSVKAEREKWQAAQRGLMHKLEKQLAGIGSSGRVPDITLADMLAPEAAAGVEVGGLAPLHHGGDSPRVSMEAQLSRQQPRLVASTRPTSIAQRASMTVWGRYLSNHRSPMLSPTMSEVERAGLSLRASLPHLMPAERQRLESGCGPLAEGLCLSASQSASTESRLPTMAGWRHRNACRQSYSPADSGMKAPDTAESSDVAANMATPGREAGSSRLHFLRRPLRNSLNIKRKGVSGAAPSDEEAVIRRWAETTLFPEQIALALAAEPAVRPTVSSEVADSAARASRSLTAETLLSFAPHGSCQRHELTLVAAEGSLDIAAEADGSPLVSAFDGKYDRGQPFVSPKKPAAQSSQSPEAALELAAQRPGSSGGRGFARASLADWGRAVGTPVSGGPAPGIPRGSPPRVSPSSVGGPALVVHSPVWSFDAAGLPTDRSTATVRSMQLPSPPRQRPGRRREPAAAAAAEPPPSGNFPGGNAAADTAADRQSAALADERPESSAGLDRSISFKCRKITSSLPDLGSAAAVLQRSPPEKAPAAIQATAAAQLPAVVHDATAVMAAEKAAAIVEPARAVSSVSWQAAVAAAAASSSVSVQPTAAPAAEKSSAQGFTANLPTNTLKLAAGLLEKNKATMKEPAQNACTGTEASRAPEVTIPISAQSAEAKASASLASVSASSKPAGLAALEKNTESNASDPLCNSIARAAVASVKSAKADLSAPSAKQEESAASSSPVLDAFFAKTAAISIAATAAKSTAFMAAAVAPVNRPAEVPAASLAAPAFSAPLPQQLDVAIDWKPRQKAAAQSCSSNPWSMLAPAAANASAAAAVGWGPKKVTTPASPSPQKVTINPDAETFQTAGSEVSVDVFLPASSAVDLPKVTEEETGRDTSQSDPAEGKDGKGVERDVVEESRPKGEAAAEAGAGEAEGDKGASLPEKCKSAMQSMKSTCEAVGSMAAAAASAPSGSDDGDESDESADAAAADSSSDDGAGAAGSQDSQWESGTSESESADESAEVAAAASTAASGTDVEDDASDGELESDEEESAAVEVSEGLLRTVSTELDVDDIMSMTAADLDARKIKGLADGGGSSTSKVISLEVFAGLRTVQTLAAAHDFCDEGDGSAPEEEADGEGRASDALSGKLGNVKCPLPSELLPDSIFSSPAAHAAEADTSFTLRRRPAGKGRRGGRRGRG